MRRPEPDVRERVVGLRAMIRDAAEHGSGHDGVDPLRSVFLIGSCAGEIPDDWYQDVDIHFLFDGIALSRETLEWLADLLRRCRSVSDGSCRVDTFVKDRHWKMVPNRSHGDNIGIHATLLNSADHLRRVHVNSVLAANMYVRCGVVHGDHPARIRGWRPVGAAEYAHSVGGVGWLAENFARAVSLYVLTPGDHTFYPFIGGYTWNIASSALFHLYSLQRGGVTSRQGALDAFVADPDVPSAAGEAARLLHEHREDPAGDPAFGRRQINGVSVVLDIVAARLARLLPAYYGAAPAGWEPGRVASHTGLYTGPLDGLGGAPDVVDVVREEGGEYHASIEAALTVAQRAAGGAVSPKENFEFVRDLSAGTGPATKVRVWDSASLPRRLFSEDYAAARGARPETDLYFGWEDGVAALLQRLHEVCIELGPECPTVTVLARITAAIANDRLAAGGLAARIDGEVDQVFAVMGQLGELLRPVVEPVFPGPVAGAGQRRTG